MAKTPGLDRQGVRLREVPLDIGLANAFSEYRRRIAYERLLLDLIEGDPTLFVRRDEVEAQWAWIDRIRAAWAREGHVRPRPYPAGTLGPVGRDRADRARRHQLARVDGTAPDRIATVTDRIIERSKPTRRRYLDLMAEQKERRDQPAAPVVRQFRAWFRRIGRGQGGDQHARAARTSASSPPTTTCCRRISPTAAIPSR